MKNKIGNLVRHISPTNQLLEKKPKKKYLLPKIVNFLFLIYANSVSKLPTHAFPVGNMMFIAAERGKNVQVNCADVGERSVSVVARTGVQK